MDMDNHQEGETQGVKICDPPIKVNTAADTLATSLSLLGKHMFPDLVARKAAQEEELTQDVPEEPPQNTGSGLLSSSTEPETSSTEPEIGDCQDRRDDVTEDTTNEATDEATIGATDEATIGASIGATDEASIGATDEATIGATNEATDEATIGGTDEATIGGTDEATIRATDEATDEATIGDTDEATIGTTDEATIGATDEATIGATDEATIGATDEANDEAADEATEEVTIGATDGATIGATDEATNDGTNATTNDAANATQSDSEDFVVPVLAQAKLEEQGLSSEGRSSPPLEASVQESPPAAHGASHHDEDVMAESWRRHRKHVFVLSEAGKPIYSRYGSEEALSSTMGVMMALVSFVQSGDNIIRSVYSEEHTVVFLQKGPLVLVCVSSSRQSEQQLRAELLYVYYQIVSMLTQASISRIFEHKKNYDLRRLLAGSEKILDGLLDLVDWDPSFLLSAVHCLPLAASLRDSLGQILQKAITPNLVFSILVAKKQLVTVVQERAVIDDARLEPADVHLLLNLVGASSAFRAGEIWTPICLPLFNPDCYFYAYISYLDPPECTVCLLLLSTDKEAFYAVADCKRRIEEAMTAQGSLALIAKARPYAVSQVGVADLRHFMYKPFDVPDNHRQLTQFTSPEMEAPYHTEEEKMRLLDLYRFMHSRIHSSSRPLKLIYHVAQRETLLAWVTSKFELYTCFSPLVTKACAITVITKLLRWIKKEEDRLFIRYPPKYSTTPNPAKSSRGAKTEALDSADNSLLSLL